ncbi:MAG: chromosomal replication initiator protein DnaA [Epsilonproteobacteria bacterium]|nr:chromosomal replication initiator protein DnaA [Campylobacterota bacterium]
MLIANVLNLLKNEISENEYQRYVKQLKFQEDVSSSDTIVFIAPNPLIAKWIKTKYCDKIADIYEGQSGQKPTILIKTKDTIEGVNKPIITQEPKVVSTILNPSYTFDTFIVGSSNQFAFSSAQAVAKKPGSNYNPLFIYGFSGLGKTHLMQAIGNHAVHSGHSVIYTTSEQFMNDFIYNIKNQTMDRFRKKYRECDFLLIDDIQFLSRKEQTQEEFFHTFNELHSLNKQIILTSDKPPKKIAGFEERLSSRFEWGLIADVQPPGLETKISIIRKKCELDGVELGEDIINYIASNMGDNIREIESAIINLNAHAKMLSQEITLDFAKHVMKEQIKEKRKNITLEDIIKTISKELNVKPSDIKSKKRNKNIVEARRIGIYLARALTPNSMPALASYFDMKDHTAVSHNMKKINEMLESNENFKVRVEEIKNKIASNDM